MKKRIDSVAPDTPLREAARKMTVRHTTSLPVCEGPTIVGVLTLRDVISRATAPGCDPRATLVREVMTLPTIYGHEDQNVYEATQIMRRWRLRRLPVLNRDMRLVGIVSWRDLHRRGTSNRRTRPGITRRLGKALSRV